MCTAISFKSKDHYFGRNMDYEFSYNETVTITPRNYCFNFRNGYTIKKHYAIIGMAYVVDNYPLYYDGTNEAGLSMAGLNFPDNAVYHPESSGKDNISPFEFIPWILCKCNSVCDAKKLTEQINLVNINFSRELPLSPLHWIISDKSDSIVVESTKDGIKIYDNPAGVLTNNPPFDYHMNNLCNYMHISPNQPENHISPDVKLSPYSRGMGGLGLPGDLSSSSRFIRAAFAKSNSICEPDERSSVNQFFHILGSVEQQRGCVNVGENQYEITIYSSCCNTRTGVYYYKTYDNSQISAVDMHRVCLDNNKLISYPLLKDTNITWQN